MRILPFLVFLAGGWLAPVPALAAAPATEIEALLARLRGLEGAVFIRNGTEHTAPEAEAHLRMKWEKQAGQIRTAEEFIARCCSRSLASGERYRIRFREGAVRFADEVLQEWLQEIRKRPAAPAPLPEQEEKGAGTDAGVAGKPPAGVAQPAGSRRGEAAGAGR